MNSCSEPVHYLDGRIDTFFFIIPRVFFIHFITFALEQTGNFMNILSTETFFSRYDLILYEYILFCGHPKKAVAITFPANGIVFA
jgi:hypothetical protein